MPRPAPLPVDRLFRAFSDRTRLRILHLLSTGEVCVNDLVSTLRLPQPTVSRHLSYLKRSGLVTTRRESSWIYYALAEARSPFHAKLLDCLSSCFADVPELARDATRAQKKAARPCC